MPRKPKGQQPTTAAPGQAYGKRQAQEQSQQVAPLPQQPGPGEPPPNPMQAVQEFPFEGGPGLAAPPQDNEPLQPNPPALPEPPAMNPAMARLAKMLPVLEAHANAPESTAAFKSFFLQLRGSIPPEVTVADLVEGD